MRIYDLSGTRRLGSLSRKAATDGTRISPRPGVVLEFRTRADRAESGALRGVELSTALCLIEGSEDALVSVPGFTPA